jgi:hypothetical protein
MATGFAETSARIERLYAAARAQRLRDEREAGRRRFTLTDSDIWRGCSSLPPMPASERLAIRREAAARKRRACARGGGRRKTTDSARPSSL